MAEAVTLGRTATGLSDSGGTLLQRKCAACEEEEEETIRRAPREGMAPPAAGAAPPPTAAGPPAEGELPAMPEERPGETAVGSLVVDDEVAELGPGQVRKSEFLGHLQRAVCETVDAGTAETGFSSESCPWIAYWFAFYRDQSAAHMVRALRKFAPESAAANSANDYSAIVLARVRRSVAVWARTGEITGVPAGATAELTGGEAGPLGVPGLQFKGQGVGAPPASPPAVRGQLGAGQPLNGSVRSRMESAFGAGFGRVRVHTGDDATRLSRNLKARAFTVGEHIAFVRGEFKPGTLIGVALLAHELAHVVQQGEGDPVREPLRKGEAESGALEHDADMSAVGAMVSLWGKSVGYLRDTRRQAIPRLKSGLRLQRCGSCSGSKKLADQRAGTALPDVGTKDKIRRELFPRSTSAAGAPLTWDGASVGGVVTPAAQVKRDELKAELTQALRDHLTAAMPHINAKAGLRRLPMTEFEGAGRAAKQVTDNRFSAWTAPAVLTASQASVRHNFQFRGSGPDQTLFDAYDPAQRAATGHPIDPDDLANWIAETDSAANTVQSSHNFDPNRGGEEQTFLQTEILDPFVAANRPDLEKYDTFGFAISGDQIVAPSSVSGAFSDVAANPGEPSPAERRARWGMWALLVHEYLHTLAHPTFSLAARGNRIMTEGFTEMFTKETLEAELPNAPGNVALRTEIEGGDFGAPPAGIVPAYSAGSYAEYLTRAENIRDTAIGPPGGENAVKAAFFQGHVEFLGLTPSGAEAPARTGPPDQIAVPSGITTLSQLAAATGVSEAEIVAANSGFSPGDPLPAEMIVPGTREHIAVAARGFAGTIRVESKAQIAAQNGVTESDLERANPGVNWSALTEGQRILIPKH